MTGALRIVCAVFVAWLLAVAGPALAQPLMAKSCTLGAEAQLGVSEVRGSDSWNCEGTSKDLDASHTWVRVAGADLPRGKHTLISDAMAMNGVLVAIDTDGALSERYFNDREIARHWTTGTRFALPVDFGERPRALYVRVDKPLGTAVASGLQLVDPGVAAWEKDASLVFLGIVVGSLLLVAMATGLMAAALRRRFAWYHFAFSLLLTSYVVTSGSLIFLVAPDLSLWWRSAISYASVAWAIALLAPFALDFFEPGILSRRMRRAAIFCGLLAFAAGLMLPLGALLGVSLRSLFNMLFIPGTVVTFVLTLYAMNRGSQSARAFALAWSVPFIFSIDRMARALGAYSLPTIADFGFYGALAVEAAAIMVAIAWRFDQLRRERDEALADQHRLAEEARRDPLTKLLNRRSFDNWRWHEGEVLALLDLDRFKDINDTYGHEAGDIVLALVGQVLLRHVADDTLLEAWRLGGEEFALAIHADDLDEAARVADSIRSRIARDIADSDLGLMQSVTASAGLSSVRPDDPDAAFRNADRMLYAAKMSGRDRTCFRIAEPVIEYADQLSLSRKSA